MRPSFLYPLCLFGFASCGEPDTKLVALTPDIVVAPEEVAFGDIVKLYNVRQEVQVLNAGRGPLNISKIELEVAGGHTEVFRVETEPETTDGSFATVSAGEALPLAIGFQPEQYLDYRARILVHSDDADQPILAVPLSGSGVVGSTPDIELSSYSINFGFVPKNETESGYFTIKNVGDGPLEILGVDLDSDHFRLVTNPSDQTIAAGSEFAVVAEYTPVDDRNGHSVDVSIRSTDPDESEVTVVLVGGDGGAYQVPEAKIDCDALQGLSAPTTVALRAPDSTDPEDTDNVHDLTHEWQVTARPELSRTYITYPNEDEPDFFIDVAGSYLVQLVVTDFNGVSSEPDECEVVVIPEEELYIALSWDKNNADLDLHLVPDGQPMWGPRTCFYCCTRPSWRTSDFDWGAPLYTLDNTIGYGPESIEVSQPTDEVGYNIRVYYFNDKGGEDTEATISIYIDGILRETLTATLPTDRHRWKVGRVSFDGPPTDPGRVGTFTAEDVVEGWGPSIDPLCPEVYCY